MLKLTINKPAFDAFFAGDEIAGIKIRLQNGIVQFRPAFAVDDTDIAPIEDRTRGGIEVRIEGLWRDEIYDALENPAGNPFFILQRAGQGWISAIPHRGEPKWEPPRTMPVMRVWSQKKVTAISPEQMERVGDMPVPAFVIEVRNAKKNVDAYYAKKRPGRPRVRSPSNST